MKQILWILAVAAPLHAGPVDELLATYKQQGASPNAQAGAAAWNEPNAASGQARSCASCHGTNLRNAGSHKETGETIKPLAPSVNPERLTDAKFIEKWFNRNCKWTFGRVCTAQEKANFLAFIRRQ